MRGRKEARTFAGSVSWYSDPQSPRRENGGVGTLELDRLDSSSSRSSKSACRVQRSNSKPSLGLIRQAFAIAQDGPIDDHVPLF